MPLSREVAALPLELRRQDGGGVYCIHIQRQFIITDDQGEEVFIVLRDFKTN